MVNGATRRNRNGMTMLQDSRDEVMQHRADSSVLWSLAKDTKDEMKQKKKEEQAKKEQ